jgi:uncharacterized protein YkwD
VGDSTIQRTVAIFLSVLLLAIGVTAAVAQSGYEPVPQTPELASEEVQVAYLTNVYREQAGLAPLRMNWQLTQATRWFAWDKTATLPPDDCTDTAHLDSFGNYPNVRDAAFGYQGMAGAENAWCVYEPPQIAVDGWMASPPHAENILNPDQREVGLGYSTNNRGWLAQDFGADPNYAPVVIDDEALQTTSRDVSLYIYNIQPVNNIQSLRPATQVQVSEDECALDASWQAYADRKGFTLSSGEGWKTVYVRSRDAYGHTSTANDSIYLGSNPPLDEIGEAQMATIRPSVTVYQLDGGGRSSVQFSPGWLTDTFMDRNNNSLSTVSDSAAWDGKTAVVPSHDFTWAWTTKFYEDIPLVAYFRLKVSDKGASGTLASVSILAGANSYGPLNLTGASFPASNQYIEVPLAFTFSPDSTHGFLEFVVQSSGSATVSVDAVTVFTAPQALTGATMTWDLPDGHYRGEGIWVRYSNADGSNFTAIQDGVTARPSLAADPQSLTFLAGLQPDDPQPKSSVYIHTSCGSEFTWSASAANSWLRVAEQAEQVDLSVSTAGLTPGGYDTTLVVRPSDPSIDAVNIPVHLTVVPDLQTLFLPSIRN